MFKLRIVQAEKGDCLVLVYGADQPRHMLIDGGPGGVFPAYLAPELRRIQASGGQLDQVVLSHIDDDHVHGLLDLFDHLQTPHDKTVPGLHVGELWHNTFSQMVGPSRAADIAEALAAPRSRDPDDPASLLLDLAARSIDQGDQLTHCAVALGVPVNPGFPPLPPDTGPVGMLCSDTAGAPRALDGVTVHILGPSRQNLDRLGKEWTDWLNRPQKRGLDTTYPNLSSIMFLVESPGGKRLLLTGDGRADELEDALKKSGLLKPSAKQFPVDVLKMPHHGSIRNMTAEFLRTVPAQHYVISADGENDNPDIAALELLADVRAADGQPYTIWITNETASTCKLRETRPQDRYHYRFVQLPYDTASDQQVLELDLEAADPAAPYSPLPPPFRPVAIKGGGARVDAAVNAGPTVNLDSEAAAPVDTKPAPSKQPKRREANMAKGMSIHIGLNRVDPNHYTDQYGRPWEGKLVACESDAHCMEAIARKQGFTPTVLLSDAATSDAVIAAIKDAAKQLQTGDALFLSYSGHGGQVPDRNGATDDEPDRMDETWCLFDRQLVDDELFALWGEFQPGVHILMLSDSCHSGTVSRDAAEEAAKTGPAVRELPAEVQVGTYQAHRDTYDRIQAETPDAGASEPKASVVLISGCQDNQVSMDGRVNGLFTEKLLLTWNDGRYRGGIPRFHQQIIARMPRTQQPNLYRVGPTDAVYEQRRPFSI